MRRSSHLIPFLLALACLSLVTGGVAALKAEPAFAASTSLPPALYVGGDFTLSNTAKITSPLVGSPGQPSAGLYVKGRFTNTSSGSLSSVKQYLGSAAPALSLFMPDAQFNALVARAQNAASTTATPANTFAGLTYSDAKDHTFTAPMVVNGNLTISGTGKCTFASLYVTGNMVVANAKANVSIATLRVNGTLTVSSGSLTRLGTTYIAGATTLTGSGTWNMGLFAAGGNLTIAGSQTLGSVTSPVRILLAGTGKPMTYSCTGIYYGLLANPSGGFSAQTSTGKIVGTVLCSGSASMTNSAFIAYDPTVANLVLDFTSPTVAITSPANLSLTNNPKPTLSYTLTDAAGGSGLNTAATLVRLDGNVPTFIASGSPLTTTPLPDGTHTVTVTTYDLAGNMGSATSTFTIDATPPSVTSFSINNGDSWTKSAGVTLNLSASDAGSGGVMMRFSNDSATLGNATWQSYAASFQWTLAGATDGTKTVYAQFKDALGNTTSATTPVSDTIGLDTTKPTLDHFVARNGATPAYNRPVFEFSATDGGTQIACTAHVEHNGQLVSAATSGEALPSAVPEGLNTLVVTAQDAAGNTASYSYDFTVALPAHPFTVQPDNLHASEGYTYGLYADDTSATGNPDGSWEGKSWKWHVTATGLPSFDFDGPVYFVALPNKADYHVQLTVTDTGTSADPGTGAECVTEQTIQTQAQAPWVNALNIEVPEGQPATLVGRFLDPGWDETHSATWSIEDKNGQSLSGPITTTLHEDNTPAMDSGYVEGKTSDSFYAQDGPYTGHLTVRDSTQASTTVDFKITPVAPNPKVDEGLPGSNTITKDAKSPVLDGGQVHLSYIQSEGDVDVYEIKGPQGQDLPSGSEVLVTLRNLPADYDIALINDLSDNTTPSTSLEGSSFMSSRLKPFGDWGDSRLKPFGDWGDSRLKPFGDWVDSFLKPFGRLKPFGPWGDSRLKPFGSWVDSSYLSGALQQDSRLKPFGDMFTIISPQQSGNVADPYVRPPLDQLLFTQMRSSQADHKSLDGWSFLEENYTGLDGTASGDTTTFSQLGFNNADAADWKIASTSAHPGTAPEVVYEQKEFVGGHIYVAIKGSNGAYSADDPYALQVETSLPLDVASYINETTPDQPVKVQDNPTETPFNPDPTPPAVSEPLTLFVTQSQRIDALYGQGTFANTILPKLHQVCSNDLVRGTVLSVPSTYFNDWDVTPWKTELANDVAKKIREEVIQPYLKAHPTIKYVVLVGSDEVIPQYRVPDLTTMGNERQYVDDASLTASSSLLDSMLDYMVLTDDYYVDADGVPYQGTYMYTPDIAISRLVETPAEIAGEIDRFITHNGRLSGGSSIVTGQDFFADGAQRVESILQTAGLKPVDNISNDWKKSDFLSNMPTGGANVANANMHFAHYGGISAYGYHHMHDTGFPWMNELLSSNEIKDSSSFAGKLVFTIGCHAGLNVPDDQVDMSDYVTGQPDPRLDVAQAMAEQQGVLVASTGFGFGDDTGISGTEALLGTFADQATTSDALTVQEDPTTPAKEETGQSIGWALKEAKQRYVGSLTTITPYDEKSCDEFTMYGMPQYRLECDTHEPTAVGERFDMTNAASAGLGAPVDYFTLTVVDNGQSKTYPAVPIYKVTSSDGSTYYTADGDVQATSERPKQPRVWINLGSGGNNPVHSAIFTPGDYVDNANFNPTIAWTDMDNAVDTNEFQVSTDGWWPAPPVTVRTVGTGGAREQNLIVLAGQFRATSDPVAATVIGTERLWRSMTVTLVRGPETDNVPPTVSNVEFTNKGNDWTATVDAQDPSGIARIDVTPVGMSAAPITTKWSPASLATSFAIPFTLAVADPANAQFQVTVVDGAGNATPMTGKTRYFTLPPTGTATVNGGASVTYSPLVALTSQVTLADQMRTSTDGANWTAWKTYDPSILVALPGLPGDKTVWVEYRNAGEQTLVISIAIRLESPPIVAGNYHSLALRYDGKPYGWGMNGNGRVGDGTNVNRTSPVPLDASVPWSTMAAGMVYRAHNLAIGTDGRLYAWGYNGQGELGDGSTVDRWSPVDFPHDAPISATGWTAVAIGATQSDGINDGRLFAWGQNTGTDHLGQLGDLTMTDQSSPSQVGNVGGWAAVAAGYNHTLALKTDGTLYSWGADNRFGELGRTAGSAMAPGQVGSDSDWVAIAAGYEDSFAIKADGSLYAWGYNDSGKLGDGTSTARPLPVKIAGSNWVAVSAGGFHTVALKTDGSLWAWGSNQKGQLGDGTQTDSLTPKEIASGSTWSAVSAGWWHTLALKADGTLWAWGDNSSGELGDGTTNGPVLTPEQIVSPANWPSGSLADITPPTTIVHNADAAWHNTDVTLAFTATDAGTGVARTEYSVGGGAWTTGTSVTVASFANDGIHEVRYRSVDNAGNVEPAQSASVKIDAHPPVTFVDAPSGWQNTPVTVYLRASDGLSGVAETDYYLDSSPWTTGTSVFVDAPVNGSNDGQHVIWYGSRDNAGNQESSHWRLVQIDATKPTVTIASPTNGSVTSDQTPQLLFNAADTHLTGIVVRVDGNVVTKVSGDNLDMLADGQHSVTVTATDAAGNASTAASTFTVAAGAVAPTVTSPNGGENWVIGSSHAITWESGNGGPVTIELSRDGGTNWETLFASTGNDGSESWTVSGSASSQARVRISNANGADSSDTDFIIAAPVAPTVAAPNGGENWAVGSAETITWTPGNGGQVTMELSRNGGTNWETLFASIVNDGSESWTVSGAGTGQALMRISSSSGSDVSNADFTIPGIASHVDFATGNSPFAVAFGDVNRDGLKDTVTANDASSTVSVLLGNGDGTFRTKADYATGTSPVGVAVADFNGDGKQDLVTASSSGIPTPTISVLLGNGDGTFQARVDYTAPYEASSVAVADLNSDGKQDLVTGGASGSSEVCVMLGNGNGTFGSGVAYATGLSPEGIALADVNGDYKQDLVTANYGAGTASVLLGNGNGTFQAKVDYTTGTLPADVVLADLNGDGKQDLVTANWSSSVSVLLGNGNGTFQAKSDYAAGADEAVTVTDVNRDGNPDLAVADRNNNAVSVLTGKGDGTFKPKTDYIVGTYPYDVKAADINGDGTQDLVAANRSDNTISVLLNIPASPSSAAQFATRVGYSTGSGPSGLAVADLDGDGKQDVATANYGGKSVSVLLGDGTGTFQAKVDYLTGGALESVVVADFNGDQKKDVATADYGGNVSVLLGKGDGTFQAHLDFPVDSQAMDVAVADLNGDGWQDLVTANNGASSVSVLLGNGNGTFQGRVDYATGTSPDAVAIADVNGDGKQDLVSANSGANSVSVLMGNGNGTFSSKVDYLTAAQPNDVVAADVDGDGKQDLVTANKLASSVSVLLGNGNGTFQTKFDHTVGSQPDSVAIADLNGDGKQDLVTANYAAANISILQGTGSGGFATKVDCAAGSYPFDVEAADLNGDGMPDLVTANNASSTVGVLLNKTPL